MANKKDPELEVQRKTRIMLATFKLMSQKSVEEMTMADVAKESSISPGLVSYYFQNKENLIVETAHFILNIRKEGLFTLAKMKTSAKNRIKKFAELALPSQDEVEIIAKFFIHLWMYSQKSPRVSEVFMGLVHEQQDFVEKIAQQLRQEGVVKKGNMKAKAFLINAVLDGLGIHMTLKPEWTKKQIHKMFHTMINQIIQSDI